MPFDRKRSHSTRGTAKPRLSIRARLMVLSLLAITPLVFDRVRLAESSRNERLQTAYAEVTDLSRRARDDQVETIETTRSLMRLVARAYVAMAPRESDCGPMLSGFASDVSWVGSLSLVDADGRIICSTRKQAVGLNVGDRDYVKEARRTWDFVLSDYLTERSYEKSAVMVAYPVFRHDENANVILLASVDLHWLARLGDGMETRPRSAAYLLDGKGTVLAGVQGPDRLLGKTFAQHPLVRHVLSHPDGTVTLDGLDGVRRIFGYASLPGTDARIVIGFDERDILTRIDRETGIAYLQIAFFALLTMIAAWLLGEHLIVEPIRAFSRAATRIGQGDLDVHLSPENWASEFSPLAIALADMARKLAARERSLRDANEHLEELASIDSLSELANRRSFDARLAAEWQRAMEQERSIALLMVDVDHFKLFNDRYGHVQGDFCLRQVAHVLTTMAEANTDFPARYGGEEFVLLLPGANVTTALDTAERLRRAMQALRIRNEGAPGGGFITVSIGVAARVPLAVEAPQSLVEAADSALYVAKRRGRNAVVADSEPDLAEAG